MTKASREKEQPMFWLCVETYRGSGRPSRFWVVESKESPDKPTLVRGCGCGIHQGHDGLHRPYPFNGMGGQVLESYKTEDAAWKAANEMICADSEGFAQWA